VQTAIFETRRASRPIPTPTPYGDFAPSLAGLGFSVGPLVAGTLRPIGSAFAGTRDVDEVEAVAAHCPTANIGIATNDLAVLELEGDAALETLHRFGPLCEAPVAAIGSTRLVFFALQGGLPSCRNARPGVSIRSRGDYVVAPPSWLAASGLCRWVRSPWESFLVPLAPGWLIDLAGGTHG